MKKQVLRIVLALALCLSLLPAVSVPAAAAAATPTVEYGYIYANGTPITIEAGTTTGYTKIWYGDESAPTYLDVNPLTDGEQFEADLSSYTIYGGSKDGAVASTRITMTGGTVEFIYGGSGASGSVTDDTEVIINGGKVRASVYGGGDQSSVGGKASVTVNDGTVGLEFSGHAVYGGGYRSNVGSTEVTITGGEANEVYGGGKDGTVDGSAKVTMTGGTVKSIYGGGYYGGAGSTEVIIDTDGKVDSVYGGSRFSSVTGKASVTIKGTVSNSVYGGGAAGGVGSSEVLIDTDGKVGNGGFGGIPGEVYGGGYTSLYGSGTVTGDTNVTIRGTVTGEVYGGGVSSADVGGSTNVLIDTGGKVAGDVYGGGYQSSVAGTASVTIKGAVTKRYGMMGSSSGGNVYGGGYNGGAVGSVHVKCENGSADKITLEDGIYRTASDGDFQSATAGETALQGYFEYLSAGHYELSGTADPEGHDIDCTDENCGLRLTDAAVSHTLNADGSCDVCGYILYDLWVGGVQVGGAPDESGNITVTGDTITGTVTYNPSTATLTLNGASITAAETPVDVGNNPPCGVYSDSALNLVLTGANTITASTTDYSAGVMADARDLAISGGGSLKINTCGYGINALKLVTNGVTIEIIDSVYAISLNAGGTITDSTVRAVGSNTGISTTTGMIEIDNSSVYAEGGNYSFYGTSDEVSVHLGSGAHVKAEGTIGVQGGVTSGGSGYLRGVSGNSFEYKEAGSLEYSGTYFEYVGAGHLGTAVPNRDGRTHSYSCKCEDPTMQTTVTEGHSLTYSASDNVITESCVCSHSATATLTPPAGPLIWNGQTREAKVEYSDNWAGGRETTITYTGAEYAASTEAPRKPGTYTARITIGVAAASVSFTIEKAAASVNTAPSAIENLVYTGEAQELVTAGTVDAVDHGVTMQYSLDGTTYTTDIPTATNAGSYTVRYKAVGGDYHNDSTPVSVTVTIDKLDISSAAITLGGELTYNGREQTMAVSSVAVGSLPLTDADYTVSGNTGTNAGNHYQLTVTAKDGGNFTGSATKTWSIARAPMTITANDVILAVGGTLPSPSELTYTVTGLVNDETADDVLTTKPALAYAATPDMDQNGTTAITVSGAAADNYAITYVNGTLTVYAEVRFNGNGCTFDLWIGNIAAGQSANAAARTQYIIEDDGDIGKFMSGLMLRDGYNFVGWYLNEDGTGAPYDFNSEVTTNVTLYAKWEPQTLTGTVTISGDMQIGSTLTATVTDTNNTGTLSYQWYRYVENNTAITGATSSIYTLTADEIGFGIYCVVSSSEQTGSIQEYASGTVKRKEVSLSGADTSVTYDGGTYDVSQMFTIDPNAGEATYAITGGTGEGTLNGSVLTITKAGTIAIRLNTAVKDDYAAGSATATLTVNKAQATVTADDKEVYIGSLMPELTYKVSGLIGDDTIRVELSCDANMNRAGETPIVVSAADPNGNYEITTVNGTLTVKYYPYVPIITPTYPPVIQEGDGGDVSATPAKPEKGDTVIITPDPDLGKEVDTVVVIDENGDPVAVTDNGDGTYSFKQPSGKVTVTVTFKEIKETCMGDHTCPMYGYTDLDMTAWYHDGVHFCIENDLMNGTGTNTFAPGMTTSRAMIVTILWRLEGSPIHGQGKSGTFVDVPEYQWYTEAVEWAAASGITYGTGDGTTFSPNDPITREQLATILYRYEQYKGGGFKGMWMFRMDYVDLAEVSDWAYEAMCWMTMNGIVNGKPGKVLDAKGSATRAEAAAMLYRYCEVMTREDDN